METSKKSKVREKYQQAIRDYKKMLYLYRDETVDPIKKDSEAIISDWKNIRSKED